MPTIGEIKMGREIGYKQDQRYIWSACADCGKERWVRCAKGKAQFTYCLTCSSLRSRPRGVEHPYWKGGRSKCSSGYVKVKLYPADRFYAMVQREGYVMEYRLVVAKRLGRCLLPSEKVHHMNGIRDDNRDQNLKLASRLDHETYNSLCKNCELRKEIRLLRWQIKELMAHVQGQLQL